MNPNLPPKGSAEWYLLREALGQAYPALLGDLQSLIVEPLINDDSPRQYRALAVFHASVVIPTEQYNFAEAADGLRSFMREHPVLRIRFQRTFDGTLLPALRMFALYQDYYDFYEPI